VQARPSSEILPGMSQPTALGVGDFNGDGKSNVVAVEKGS
jgi:hypothetical protein